MAMKLYELGCVRSCEVTIIYIYIYSVHGYIVNVV